MPSSPQRLAYVISPHGFGHAARATAVMLALRQLDPTLRFDLFTQVPRWFFEASGLTDYTYHDVCTDVGMAQSTPLCEDVQATVQRLDAFFPCDPTLVTSLATQMRARACALVLCDIAPLGLLAAQAARLPSLLIENFTWDWIYQHYVSEAPALAKHIAYLRAVRATATYHIQLEPVCDPQPVALRAGPVSRAARTPAAATRARLGIAATTPLVLITLGGIPGALPTVLPLRHVPQVTFVLLGGAEVATQRDNLVLLPHHSAFFSPDLIHASDAVISKVGYSTLVEVYSAGVPFGYITRARFPESPVLAAYIAAHMPGVALSPAAFHDGSWLAALPTLLTLPRQPPPAVNGAAQIAQFVHTLLHSGPA